MVVGGAGGAPPPAAPAVPAAVVCGGVAEPLRHLFALPRGRGPSQTPKFLSPGPPSPWLPALFTRAASQLPRSRRVPQRHPHPVSQEAKPPAGTLFPQEKPVPRPTRVQGCRGRSPRRNKVIFSPFPGGEGGRGDGGNKASQRQGQPARQKTLSRVPRRILAPSGHLLHRLRQCRFRLSPGDARGEAPCIRKLKIPPSRREGGWGDGGRKAS